MKKLISLILVFACAFMCASAFATTDVTVAVLDEIYGSSLELSYSFLGGYLELDMIEGTMTYLLTDEDYILEFYTYEGDAYIWNGEMDIGESITGALAVADTFDEDFGLFLIFLVGDDGSDLFAYCPSLSDADLADLNGEVYNDFEAYSDVVIDAYVDMVIG